MTEEDALEEVKEISTYTNIDFSYHERICKIVEEYPQLTDEVCGQFKTLLQEKLNKSSYNVFGTLCNIFRTIESIVKLQPERIDEALTLLEISWQSLGNVGSIEKSYECLANIVKSNSELGDKTFKAFKNALDNFRPREDKISGELYYYLATIIESQPQLRDEAFKLFETALQSDKNDHNSLQSVYRHLGKAVENNPELADKCFDFYKIALQSDKNETVGFLSNPIEEIYSSIHDIIDKHPKLSDRCFDLYNIALQSDKNDGSSLAQSYFYIRWISSEHPELTDKCLELIKIALQSKNNTSYSLGKACEELSSIVCKRPELVDKSLELFKMALQSDQHYSEYNSEYIYKALAEIIEKQPQLANKVFDIYKTAIHKGIDLEAACRTLSNIVQTQPDVSQQVLNIFTSVILSDNNIAKINELYSDGHSHGNIYIVLTKIIEIRPEQRKQVFDVFRHCSQSQELDDRTLSKLYSALYSVAGYYKPELSKQVLDTINFALKSEKNGHDSLEEVNGCLGKIVETQPDLAKQVLDIVNLSIKSDKNNQYSLSRAYRVLDEISSSHPELSKQVLDTINFALKSEKNGDYSLIAANMYLGKIVETQPDLAKQVLDIVNLSIKSDENNSTSHAEAYDVLNAVVKTQPELSRKIIGILQEDVLSDRDYSSKLSHKFRTLKLITENLPNLSEQALETVKLYLQSDKNSSYSLEWAYSVLGSITRVNPDLAEQVLYSIKHALQSDKNDGDSLKSAYSALVDIARFQPKLAKQVFDTLKTTLQSDKNNYSSFEGIMENLSSLADTNPDWAKQAVDTINSALKYMRHDYSSFAYEALAKIVKTKPELAQQVFDTFKIGFNVEENDYGDRSKFEVAYRILHSIVQNQPQLADKVVDVYKVALESEKNDEYRIRDALGYLRDIVKVRPQTIASVVEVYNKALQSDKIDHYTVENNSLEKLYDCLDGNIIETRPELGKELVDGYKIILQSDNVGNDLQKKLYQSLIKIVKAQPHLAEQVLDVFKTTLYNDLYYCYGTLHKIVEVRPDLSEQVLNNLKTELNSLRNTSVSLQEAYKISTTIMKAKPELANQVFDTLKIALQSHENDNDAYREVCMTANLVIAANPQLVGQLFDLVETTGWYENMRTDFGHYGHESYSNYLLLTKAVAIEPELLSHELLTKIGVLRKTSYDDKKLDFMLTSLKEATPQNRMILLKKIVKYAEDMNYGVDKLYSGSQSLNIQNKEEKQILLDYLKDSSNPFSCKRFLSKNPDVAPDVLSVLDNILERNNVKEDNFPDDLRTWLNDNFEQYKEVILSSKKLFYFSDAVAQQKALIDHSVITNLSTISEENFNAFAQIYEEYSTPDYYGDEIVRQKNVLLDKGITNDLLIKNSIRDKILQFNEDDNTSMEVCMWLVKNAEKFPNFVKDCLQVKDLPYVEMCIKYLDNPEKENIGSLLNRLKRQNAETFEDFQKVYDFVQLRDMCRGACIAINEDLNGRPEQKSDIKNLIDIPALSYAMAESGVEDFKTAKLVATLFYRLNSAPANYESDENIHSLGQILKIIKMAQGAEDWMWPVLFKVDDIQHFDNDVRPGSKLSLFDACKAWKICPHMWKREAVKVGQMSLPARITAGIIIDRMFPKDADDKQIQEFCRGNDNLRQQFWQEFNKAQKIGFKEYIRQRGNDNAETKGRVLSAYYPAMDENLNQMIRGKTHLNDIITFGDKVIGKLRRLTQEELDFVINHMSFQQMSEDGKLSVCQKCLNVLVGQMDKENGGDGSLGKNRAEFPNNDLYKNNTDWLIPSTFAAAEVFGAYLPNYLKKMESVGVSVHDSVYFLPYDLDKADSRSLGEFLQEKSIYVDTQKQKRFRPSSELDVIAKNWSGLTQEERKLSYPEVLKICKSKKYTGQKYEEFAAEAADAGVYESQYKELEAFYEASLKTPCPFDTTKEFKCGNLTGKFLPRDDPRIGFFGNHTNCCQRFGGAGGSCAKSSMIDAWSQLFVIEKEDDRGKKRIVAGSWMWENEVASDGKTYKYACADNIEAIGDYEKSPLVNNIYEAMADYLTKECGYRKVTAGVGYQDAAIEKYQETVSIPLPDIYCDGYSDARTQVLISENTRAPEIDTKQESLRFIRKACRDDFRQMQKVADECFPDGDQALQIPEDDFNGFVLVDKYKGIQGYVLYDKQEKHIYDMAVMPEYRKDKNGSSSKLLGEMILEVKKLGGEWSAEARENTSLRFLKAMSARGLCALSIGEVDHIMDDGTKVYAVKFTPQIPETNTLNKDKNSSNIKNEADSVKDVNKEEIPTQKTTSGFSISSVLFGRKFSGRK